MTFGWETPPWLRAEDCTYMAVTINDPGSGQCDLSATSVRGDNATDALADLLMGPGAAGGFIVHPTLVGVVIRAGIDIRWMAQPPIAVERKSPGNWDVTVGKDEGEEVTLFSADDARQLLTRLRTEYPQ
ncbi:hypothetical protein AB0C70_38325 [Streptomyces sp. NPDC048564]|uniref:hypothetical protein n=1 Tax=Streptomyces sp. NPDC048564 TaxID=3155760 RepID=UPI00343158E4